MSLLARMRTFWSSAGKMFGGMRDLFEVFGWNRAPIHIDFVQKYRRQGIAKRIIDMPVNALWSDPPSLNADAAFQAAWNDLLAQIPVFHNIQRLDKLAGLGQFAIMVIGFEKGNLDQPVTQKSGQKVLYLQPYSEGKVQITLYEMDPKNPRYGLPVMYRVTPSGIDVRESGATANIVASIPSFNVHYSRVLHIAEGALESQVYGRSRLEPIFNDLDDIWKVVGGSAETYWLAANRGLHVDVDKDMELDPEDADELSKEMDEYQHEMRRIIRTRGVKVNEIASTVANPQSTFNVLMAGLSAATGIPQRIMIGSEAGQLASQQDRANWSDRCAERIKEYGEPIVLLPFIKLLIAAGTLPQPQSLTVDWPDSFKMNPLERAQTSAQMARSAANLATMLAKIEEMNESRARAAQPQIVQQGGFGGGGFGANAAPNAKALPAPKKSATATDATQPSEPMTTPALLPEKPEVELLTVEECRQIIGFGKHPPVFDNKKDTSPAVGSPEGK